MGITIPKKQLELTLQQAVARAESKEKLSKAWEERVARIGECPSQSYIAALGTALLAKAADERVDALSVKYGAGPNAYSMRGVVKVLVEKTPLYHYHLGVKGPEPMNNQPWFHSSRVDRAVGVDPEAKPFHRDIVRYFTELNQGTAADALTGLVTFIRLRQKAEAEEAQALGQLQIVATAPMEDLLDVLQLFINDDPENGRRGQALVAALLDLVYEEVRLPSVHNPTGLDVTVWSSGKLTLGAEVKQKSVTESSVLHLAEEAALRGIDKALFVALSPKQRRLDRETTRMEALKYHGVLISIYESVSELVAAAASASPLTAGAFAEALPNIYLHRMREHQVTLAGQQYWSDLCNGLGSGVAAQLRLG
jgi:hypothetical protein